MKFNHLVKHNGIYYLAGEDVPIEDNSVGISKPVNNTTKETIIPKKEEIVEPVEEKKVEEPIVTQKFTKTDINRMSTAELRELAKKNGINGDEYVGSELKTMLIDKLV